MNIPELIEELHEKFEELQDRVDTCEENQEPDGYVTHEELTELYEVVRSGNDEKRDKILSNWFDEHLGRIL